MPTEADIKNRLAFIQQPIWGFDQIKEFYGIELKSKDGKDAATFLAQYRIWAEQIPGKSFILDVDGQRINRWFFELFLQRRELVSIRGASIRFGMDVTSFIATLESAFKKGLISKSEAEGDFPNCYRASLISDFHRRFTQIKFKIFSTNSSYIKAVHELIASQLGVKVTPIFCATSKAIGCNPVDYANSYDILTNEPMVTMFDVWLDTRKPIQLRPDSCSWSTYLRFENALKGSVLGEPNQDMEKYRDVILAHFTS